MNGRVSRALALLLAVVMVLSLSAGMFAFAGSAQPAGALGVSEATAFPAPDGDAVLVEVVLNGSYDRRPAVDDVEVLVENGTDLAGTAGTDVTVLDAAHASPAGDRRTVVYRIATGVSPARIQSVALADGSNVNANGTYAAVRTGVRVDAATATAAVYEGGRNASAYAGETVAVVGDQYGERVDVRDAAGEFVTSEFTGAHSQVLLFPTEGRDADTGYWFAFDGRSAPDASPPEDDRRLSLRELELGIEANETAYTNEDDAIEATITSNVADRAVDVRLVFAGNGTVDRERAIRLGPDRTTEVRFTDFGLDTAYRITVTDLGTGIEASTGVITTESVAESADFAERIYTTGERGVATITVDLSATSTAQVVLGSEEVNYLREIDVTDGDGDGEVAIRWNASSGEVSAADADDAATFDTNLTAEDAIAEEIVAPAPLDPANYSLAVYVGGNLTDVAAVEVTD